MKRKTLDFSVMKEEILQNNVLEIHRFWKREFLCSNKFA